MLREAHVVDNLKAKMLISVDILGPERIDLSMALSSGHIGSCNVDFPIELKLKGNYVRRVVSAKSHILISPMS